MCSRGLKLEIELVPSTSWFTNLRSLMTQSQWDYVRQACYIAAGYKCEICGGKGHKHPVECHEVWDFNDKTNYQTLLRTIALCPSCHEVKHMGLQMKRGPIHFERAISHFINVNLVSEGEAEEYIMSAFAQHHARSQRRWTVDVSWIQRTYPTYFKKGLKLKEGFVCG